jgi:hypothetical protein
MFKQSWLPKKQGLQVHTTVSGGISIFNKLPKCFQYILEIAGSVAGALSRVDMTWIRGPALPLPSCVI